MTIRAKSIYDELGVRRVINAAGSGTILGGSALSPSIQDAMEKANENFVLMEELLEKSGQAIADVLGAEAALVTSGCFAALVLGAAGIMTGKDPEKIRRLPDTTGMKNEFIFQKSPLYRYAHAPAVAGGKMVLVGDENGTTAEELEAAIGPQTAGILYLGGAEGRPGVLRLSEVLDIAHARGVAVMSDSAYEIYPLEKMRSRASSGAELVCFGAKYVGAPHSTGIICGKKEYVEAARLNNFIAHDVQDNQNLGRGYKVDRQEIIAVVTAVKEWFTINHEERLAEEEQKIQAIIRDMGGLPHVKAELVWERNALHMYLHITLDEQALGKTAEQIRDELLEGDPVLYLSATENTLRVAVFLLGEGEQEEVAEILRQAFSR